MKKALLIILAFTLMAVAQSQEIIKNIEFDNYPYFSPVLKQLIKIDDNHFLILKETKEDYKLIKYNQNLEEIFTIPVHTRNFEYNKNTNSIIYINLNQNDKKETKCELVIYNATDGSLLDTNEIVLSPKDYNVIKYSENKKYIVLFELPKKINKEPITAHIFNSENLNLEYSLTYQVQKKNEYINLSISDNGKTIITTVSPKKELNFNIFDVNGKSKSLVKKTNQVGNRYIDNFFFEDLGNGNSKIIFSNVLNADLESIEIWDLNYNEVSSKKLKTIEFDKNSIKEIYKNSYCKLTKEHNVDLLKKREIKSPSKLKDFQLTKFIAEDEHVVISLEERVLKYNNNPSNPLWHYSVGDIILISLSKNGELEWNMVFERKNGITQNNYGNKFIQYWSGLTPVFYVDNKEIGLLYSENIGKSNYSLALRKIDRSSGKIILTKPLFTEENIFINKNYVEWFTPNILTLVNMKGSSLMGPKQDGLELQMIQISE